MKISYPTDPIVETIVNKFLSRSEAGMETYGVPMTRDDVSTEQWLTHAQEELMDGILYLEALKRKLGSDG